MGRGLRVLHGHAAHRLYSLHQTGSFRLWNRSRPFRSDYKRNAGAHQFWVWRLVGWRLRPLWRLTKGNHWDSARKGGAT